MNNCLFHVGHLFQSHSFTLWRFSIEKTYTAVLQLQHFASHIFWFKLADGSTASCISVMASAYSGVNFCEGFQDNKFHMASSTTVLFLKIKRADSSDSRLYFCGEVYNGRPKVFTATYLKVQGKMFFGYDFFYTIEQLSKM